MGRVALRMFGGEMLQCEIDSVSLLMKIPDDVVAVGIRKANMICQD